MEFLLIADLRCDLRRCVQDLQDPGQQVDASDRGAWRHLHDRLDSAGDELQPPLQLKRAHLFRDYADHAHVKGRVIDVPVEANAPLKEGDVLFRIDPTPYQYVVDQKKALLAEAETER